MSQKVIDAFNTQAEFCGPMGSAFTAELCFTFAEHLDHATKVGAFCLDWDGDPGPSADSIPLRICGGLHALVLSGRDQNLAQHYPPHCSNAPDWNHINAALIEHETFLLDWMQSPPQTNEVSRSSVIWPALMTIADQSGKPLQLLEVGASGGLNLQSSRFGYNLGGLHCGTLDSQLQLHPEWKGEAPLVSSPKISGRHGCDLNPLDPQNADDELRLRSYVWPDQVQRNARMDAALSIAKANPAPVDRQDAITWLKYHLANLPDQTCTVIYSTVAWQYLPEAARAKGAHMIMDCGKSLQKSTTELAWLRFEANGKAPGGGVQLQMWPNGIDCLLGRADFHARWVDWCGL
ncbi:MAG: DUF2332 family protein [Rhizobiaceae bacterium]|nr:DUF2332 family protein [Rhizobiaceae bacterium]